MILKVYQPLTDKWFFYDNIVLAKRWHTVIPLTMPMNDEDVNLLPEKRNPDDFVDALDVVFRDGSYKTVFFAGDGYLMNDDGKTIERL